MIEVGTQFSKTTNAKDDPDILEKASKYLERNS